MGARHEPTAIPSAGPDMGHLLDQDVVIAGDTAKGPPARSRSNRRTRRARRTSAARALPAALLAAPAGADLQREVEQLLYRQAELLDAKQWQAWMDLFADDGVYWMPARAEQTEWEGSPSIFIEDKLMMEIRKGRVTHPNAWSQAPLWETNHLVSHVAIERSRQGPHRRALALSHDGAAARLDPPLRRPLPAHAARAAPTGAADPAAARRPVQRAGAVRLRDPDLGLKLEGCNTHAHRLFVRRFGWRAAALRRRVARWPRGGAGRRQGEGRLRQHAVGPVVGARRRHPRRLPAGGEAERRQARRPAGRGAGERRPVQARRRQAAVREERQARQGRLHDRRGVLQHHAGRAARGVRQQDHLHQPERGAVVDRRQGLQPAVLRGVAGRTMPTTRPPASTPTSAT